MPVNGGGAAGAGTPRGPRDHEGTVHVLAVGAAAVRAAASAERVIMAVVAVAVVTVAFRGLRARKHGTLVFVEQLLGIVAAGAERIPKVHLAEPRVGHRLAVVWMRDVDTDVRAWLGGHSQWFTEGILTQRVLARSALLDGNAGRTGE